MHSPTLTISKVRRIALALGMLGAAIGPAHAGPVTIANEPLGSPPSLILPNVMFILDDSGSMNFNYMPDYVNDGRNLPSSNTDLTFSTGGCADTGDDTTAAVTGPPSSPAQVLGALTGQPVACNDQVGGDPPFHSPDFNEIYYNPANTYSPGVTAPNVATGVQTEMTNQNRANTAGWTSVQSDPYLSPASVSNLVGSFQDRVWCTDRADTAAGGNCRQNTSYQFPDASFPYGTTTGGAIKTILGSPYYYRIQTARYCTTAARDVCVSGSAIDPAVHTFQAPEFCSDRELTNCVAGAAVTAAHVFSGVRWCALNAAGTAVDYADCRKKKGAAPLGTTPQTYKYYIHAHHLGTTVSTPGPFPALSNEGRIIVNTVAAGGGTITGITIGGVSVIAGSIAVAGGATTTDVALLIAAAINAHVSAPDYTAVAAGANVIVSQVVKGVSGYGNQIVVSSGAVGTQSAKGRIRLTSNPSPSTANPINIASVTVNTVNMLCTHAQAANTFAATSGVSVLANGSIDSTSGSNSSTKRTAIRNAIANRINACTAVNGGYTAVADTSDVIITAPLALGATSNGQGVSRTGTGVINNFLTANMGDQSVPLQLGISSGDVTTSLIAMTGGQDEDLSGNPRVVRTGLGAFSRTDIVSTVTSYPKAPTRSDCTGATCTYDEEMTNFANWFAYYRTRMLMMKTAVGRAFVPVDTNYRVGFITICPVATTCQDANNVGRTVDLNKYLKIADFTAAHKNAWYLKLYGTVPNGGTPLREALARVGQIYAGQFDSSLTVGLTAADNEPMTRSCQPNIALLSTDGYWNLGQGMDKDGVAIGDVDGTDSAPYSLQSEGVYDGGTGATGTLADVALYYYKTDLRESGPFAQNNVRTTLKDFAAHQHMLTFTIGLGLDGDLDFERRKVPPDLASDLDKRYEFATSGDFFDIKAGTKKWPVPVQNQPSTLDDLWHAAVNGRGVFYSAKNQAQLVEGLTDMRNQLEARLGAGAAAATSNLEPVSGDNFAFTVSFFTKTWAGDVQGRTIDLNTGVVSTASLWSAAALLDLRPYTGRQLYTFDAGDDNPLVPGTNGNRMRHFCPPGAGGATCSDGAGLTPSPGEMDLFNPGLLPQLFDPAKGQDVNANAVNVVNFLRGDRSFESSALERPAATDLFRTRDSVMGDIVSAQPAYVKRSPFGYSNPVTDAGYLAFRACTEGVGTSCPPAQFPAPLLPRLGTVYAAANDGMLHAFETDVNNNPYFQTAGISTEITGDDVFVGNNAGNGAERWAYIPGLVLPKLHKLASTPYSHTYLTDATPQVGDICLSTPCAGLNDWRTILVGGLNAGGIGYYALDVTNPAAPKALWELSHGPCRAVDARGVPVGAGAPFTSDCHLGLSYGNAIITKRFFDQKWVVIVTSGFNNTVGGGDGKGYLYILDAANGQILHRLTTGIGAPDVDLAAVPPRRGPSGLSKINGWLDNGTVNNTALAVYGGDLEGNLWRFKLDFGAATNPTVTRIAVLKDSAGNTQPITVKPDFTDVAGNRIIALATGKFLEESDKIPPETADDPPVILPFKKQTIYALRDPDLSDVSSGVPTPLIPDVRDATSVKVRTFTSVGIPAEFSTTLRTIEALADDVAPPNLAVDKGWLIDLPDNGERVNIDPILQLGTLVIGSNVPTTDTCDTGGYAYTNFIDITTGSFVPGATNNMASKRISGSVLVGLNVIMLPGGQVKTIGTLASDARRTEDTPIPPLEFVGKRVSWRELFTD